MDQGWYELSHTFDGRDSPHCSRQTIKHDHSTKNALSPLCIPALFETWMVTPHRQRNSNISYRAHVHGMNMGNFSSDRHFDLAGAVRLPCSASAADPWTRGACALGVVARLKGASAIG